MIDDVTAQDVDESVFRTLARQARTRTLPELLLTTVGGALDAGLLWSQHPSLSWLAAGCAAIASYGLWGIVDRAARAAHADPAPTPVARRGLEVLFGLRDVAAIVGTSAALLAVFSFMAAALGNWNH